jgi:hypothetical protein
MKTLQQSAAIPNVLVTCFVLNVTLKPGAGALLTLYPQRSGITVILVRDSPPLRCGIPPHYIVDS